MKLFVSPHNDDAVLFGAFTLQREKPLVLTVFDSAVQFQRGHVECAAHRRRGEDIDAMKILGCQIQFAGVFDDIATRELVARALRCWHPTEVWLPAVLLQVGNEQHNLVGQIGSEVYAGAKIHRYLTYTQYGKCVTTARVPCTGLMVRKKLQALACYQSQLEIDALGCWQHFIRDQNEYMAAE